MRKNIECKWRNKALLVVKTSSIWLSLQDLARTVLTVLLLVGYTVFVAWANFDLADGRFVLFMDERIAFDGVQRILHPDSLTSLLYNILDGGDHRYGRSLWNSMAVASLIPAHLFGDQGQIIASRMLQAALLMTAFMVLAQTFVKISWLRLVLLAALFTMPYTDYYMTMPKPEPLQMFLLSIFLYFHKASSFTFGKHWFFLGMAFGTKISILPTLVVFSVVSFLQNRRDWMATSSQIRLTANYFVLGLALAVPILIPVSLAMFLFQWRVQWPQLSKNIRLATAIVATFLFVIGLHPIRRWVSATFLNTRHGSDQESINFASWAEYFLDSWLNLPAWLGMAFISALGLFFVCWLFRYHRDKYLRLPDGLVVALAGAVLNLAIFIGVNRLWGFYLHLGSVLLLTGIFSLIDSHISEAKWQRSAEIPGLLMDVGLIAIITLTITFYWTPHILASFKDLAIRTQRTEYREELATYNQVISRLDELSQAKGRMLNVAFDPVLFIPASNSDYKLVEFWGPYVNWSKDVDVLVFSSAHTTKGKDCQVASADYQACLTERDGYTKYVIGEKGYCLLDKCYRRYAELPNRGEILILEHGNPVRFEAN